MEAVKSCPFCGKKAKFIMPRIDSMVPIGIYCQKCKIEFWFYDSREKLIKNSNKIVRKWNKRNG